MAVSGSRDDWILCGDSEEIHLSAYSAPENSLVGIFCKRVRETEDEMLLGGINLDVRIWNALDENLQEKIIARLPFRSLFQSACLSKTWRLKFRSPSFQTEVQCSTASWKSYAPLFVNHKKDLVGYDGSSERWHKLPNHSYLQQDMVQNWRLRAGDGSLLCWTCGAPFPYAHINDPRLCYRKLVVHVIVSNPMMKSWRQLPSRPDMRFPEILHVVLEGSKSYKVILGSLEIQPINQRGRVGMSMQIFDSSSGSWTSESYFIEGVLYNTEFGGSAVINGVLYMLVSTWETSSEYHLISMDVNEKIWKEIPHLYQVIVEDHGKPHQPMKFYGIRFSEIFVCGSDVMLVILHFDKVSSMDFDFGESSDEEENTRDTLSVFRLDVDRGLAYEVSRAPNEMLSVAGICSAASHGDCIYFGGRFPSGLPVLYNVGTREWQWISSATDSLRSFGDTRMIQWLWTSVTYQPGLNPFLEL